jgi:hypothetical protein
MGVMVCVCANRRTGDREAEGGGGGGAQGGGLGLSIDEGDLSGLSPSMMWWLLHTVDAPSHDPSSLMLRTSSKDVARRFALPESYCLCIVVGGYSKAKESKAARYAPPPIYLGQRLVPVQPVKTGEQGGGEAGRGAPDTQSRCTLGSGWWWCRLARRGVDGTFVGERRPGGEASPHRLPPLC